MGLKFNPFTKTFDFVGSPSPGGSSFSPTRVFYVDVNGNDTTGDGSFQKPFVTAQKAFDVALASGLACLIQLGIGSFGNILCSASGWPFRISIAGCGPTVSKIGSVISLGQNIDIFSNKTVSFVHISGSGADGSQGVDGANGDPPFPGEGGTPGSQGGFVTVVGVIATTVDSNGGNGGNGGSGGGGTFSDGGNGGNGGDGGGGGSVTAKDSIIETMQSTGGSGGFGGSGGGSETGSPGNQGSDGSPSGDGLINADNVQNSIAVGSQVDFSRCSYTNVPSVSGVFNDIGGNATPVNFTNYWL